AAWSFGRHSRAAQGTSAAHDAALAHERNMLRTLIDSLPDLIYAKDVNCKFLLANEACCQAMGTTTHEVVGKDDFDFFPKDLASGFYEDEQRIIRSGEPLLNREETALYHDGRRAFVLTSKVPLRDPKGRVVGIMGIGRDITARVQAENELRAAREAAES